MQSLCWRNALVVVLATTTSCGAGVTLALAESAHEPTDDDGSDAGPETHSDAGIESHGDATPEDQGDASGADPDQSEADGGTDAAPATNGASLVGVDTSGDPLPDDEAWVFIDKSERRMVVNDGRGYREAFRVALGQVPEGDKHREGDGRTPEGEFYVCSRIRHNNFQRFLGVAYPAPEDAEWGRRHHLLQPIEYRAILRAHRRRTMPPWGTPLGGNIGIHGYGRRRDRAAQHAAGRDWTDGCIAVTNEEIERIANHVRIGTRVVIIP